MAGTGTYRVGGWRGGEGSGDKSNVEISKR